MFGIPDGLGDAIGASIKATNGLAKAITRLAEATEVQNEIKASEIRLTRGTR